MYKGYHDLNDVLRRVYHNLFYDKTVQAGFPEKGLYLKIGENGKAEKPVETGFRYKGGRIVSLFGTSWLISRGESTGSSIFELDSDIIAIPTEDPKDIEKCFCFGNSLVIARTNGKFFLQPPFNSFRSPFERFIENLDSRRFVIKKQEVNGRGYEETLLYNHDFIAVLREGLEEMLINADPERFGIRNSRLSRIDKQQLF